MGRFGLSPYSNPVESALQSFGTGLKDISMLRELTSGNQERAEAQQRQLADLQITGQQQRNQEYQDDAPNRALDRETKNKDLHTKIAQQTYGPGLKDAMEEMKQAQAEGRPPKLSSTALYSVLGFADDQSHFGGTKNEEGDQVQAAVAANKVNQNLVQLGPALQQHAQQTGQTAHRIDNTNAPGFIDDINTAFKDSNLFDGKEVEALGVDVGTGEVTVRVKAPKVDKKNWNRRPDGSEKSTGWQGVFKTPDGKDASEVSVGVQIDGKETDVPSIVPTTTPEERAWILKNVNDDKAWKTEEGHAIVAKAAAFAKQRIAQGKSPFAGDDESPKSEILKDKDGNPKKFNVNDLQNFAAKSASFGNLVLSAYGQINGDDANMKEITAKKKEIAATHGRLATLDEYSAWEGGHPDATVAQKRTQIQKIGAKNNVDETTLDKIAKEQIQDKAAKADKTMTVTSGTRQLVIDPQDIDPKTGQAMVLFKGDPQPKKELDPVAEEMKQARLSDMKDKKERQKKEDHAKLVKEKSAMVQKTDDGKTMSDDEVQEEAERLASAQEKGIKPGKSDKKVESERLKPLRDKVKEAEDSGTNVPIVGQVGGIDMDDLVKKTAESGHYSDQELKKVFTGDRGKKALEKYQSNKTPIAKKNAASSTRELPEAKTTGGKDLNEMPVPSSAKGKIIRDNKTGKRYKSDGKKWNEIA